jgi:hypothetical protein
VGSPVGDLDHTPDEYVGTDSIATRCGVIAGLICEIDAGGFVRSFGR